MLHRGNRRLKPIVAGNECWRCWRTGQSPWLCSEAGLGKYINLQAQGLQNEAVSGGFSGVCTACSVKSPGSITLTKFSVHRTSDPGQILTCVQKGLDRFNTTTQVDATGHSQSLAENSSPCAGTYWGKAELDNLWKFPPLLYKAELVVSQTSGVQHPRVLCQGEQVPSAPFLQASPSHSLFAHCSSILASHTNPTGQDAPAPACLVVGMLLNLQQCS